MEAEEMTLPILKKSSKKGRFISIELFPKWAMFVDAKHENGKLRILGIKRTSHDDLPNLLGEVKEKAKVRIAGHFANSVHQILSLPGAKRKVMNTMINLETEKALGKPTSTAWIEIKEEDALDVEKKVMGVGVDKQIVGDIFKKYKEFWGAPHTLLTYPIAVHALLESQDLLDDRACAFVDVFEDETHIIVYKGQEVRLVRDLPFGTSSFPDGISKLVQSIFQTVLFHKQTFRGQDVEHIIVEAKGHSGEICESIEKEMGKEAQSLDLAQFILNAEETEIPPAACMGLMLLPTDHHPLRLIPTAVTTQNTLQRNLLVAGSVSLVLAGIFGASQFRLQSKIRSLSDDNASLRAKISYSEDRIGNAKQGLILHKVRNGQPEWETLFRELAFVIPEEVMFHSLKVTAVGDHWKGEASGEVQLEDKSAALMRMSELVQRLKISPIFSTYTIERSLADERIRFVLKFNLSKEGGGLS
jgi:Tfp pilus assembly protein PilN